MLPSLFSYFPEGAEAILKIAAEGPGPEKKPSKVIEAAKIIGGGLGTMAGGSLAGYGAGRLVEKLTGGPVPLQYVAPISAVAGAGLGVTYGLYKAHEREALRHVLEGNKDGSQGGLPPK